MKLVIISGLSGSGKTVALNTLEDLEYYCIDNVPVGLLHVVAMHLKDSTAYRYPNVAIGVDARNEPEELEQFGLVLRALQAAGIETKVIFLQTAPDILLKRFSETRRRHPLSRDDLPLADAIQLERTLLEPIVTASDLVLDTTRTNLHQLRDLIRDRLHSAPQALSVLFQSFGFKHGLPNDVDFVFDVRCLPNPHWEPALRPLTGRDQPVMDFLSSQPMVQQFYEHLESFFTAWIPRFEAENRSYLTIAIGCTGGQHRSVYLAERLGKTFQQQRPHIGIRHRELDR
jgi:RNase adapter protein RapZ